MVVAIIGLGLIGGSMSLALKAKGFASSVIGVESNPAHAARAVELGLADRCLPLEEAVAASNLIMLATPINATEKLLPQVLDLVKEQVVFDVGSTKSVLCQLVSRHPKRGRFVATHPMWGTENSGPDAAVKNAFVQKATVICNAEDSDDDALRMVREIYGLLQMHLVYMESGAHDMHVAYISHISHITSFALANTVLERKERKMPFLNWRVADLKAR